MSSQAVSNTVKVPGPGNNGAFTGDEELARFTSVYKSKSVKHRSVTGLLTDVLVAYSRCFSQQRFVSGLCRLSTSGGICLIERGDRERHRRRFCMRVSSGSLAALAGDTGSCTYTTYDTAPCNVHGARIMHAYNFKIHDYVQSTGSTLFERSFKRCDAWKFKKKNM